MKFILSALCLVFVGFSNLQAQEIDPDFARKIRPEYKVNLDAATTEIPVQHRKKTTAEAEAELKNLQQQKSNLQAEISKLEAAKTPKGDEMYMKYSTALGWVNAQIAEREKYLTHPAYRQK